MSPNNSIALAELKKFIDIDQLISVYRVGIKDESKYCDIDLIVVTNSPVIKNILFKHKTERIDIREVMTRKDFFENASLLPYHEMELVFGENLHPDLSNSSHDLIKLASMFFYSFLRNFYLLKNSKYDKDRILKNLNDFVYAKKWLDNLPEEIVSFINEVSLARINPDSKEKSEILHLLNRAIEFSWVLIEVLDQKLRIKYPEVDSRRFFLGREPTIFISGSIDECRSLTEKKFDRLSRLKIMYLPAGFRFIFSKDDFVKKYVRRNLTFRSVSLFHSLKILIKRMVAISLLFSVNKINKPPVKKNDFFRQRIGELKVSHDGKSKYLINSFYFQFQLFEKLLSSDFDFFFSPSIKKPIRALWYVPYNYFSVRWLYLSGRIREYMVVHFNRPEALLSFKKIKGQISIFEIHGFDIGIVSKNYLKDVSSDLKKIVGLCLDWMIKPTMKKKVSQVDILYCSTPDLVVPVEKFFGRRPTWLPNPVDTKLFGPEGDIFRLEGHPACFLAARLNGDKRPEVAVDIFNKIIKPNFPKATLHLLSFGDKASFYRKTLIDGDTYFWHEFMDKPTLASKIRGADLVFGDFSIGALSLLPMQVMAMKKPIVTLDRYEIIKKEINELPELSLRLLSDADFKNDFVEKNYAYILEFHSEAAVVKKHLDNLSKFL